MSSDSSSVCSGTSSVSSSVEIVDPRRPKEGLVPNRSMLNELQEWKAYAIAIEVEAAQSREASRKEEMRLNKLLSNQFEKDSEWLRYDKHKD